VVLAVQLLYLTTDDKLHKNYTYQRQINRTRPGMKRRLDLTACFNILSFFFRLSLFYGIQKREKPPPEKRLLQVKRL